MEFLLHRRKEKGRFSGDMSRGGEENRRGKWGVEKRNSSAKEALMRGSGEGEEHSGR